MEKMLRGKTTSLLLTLLTMFLWGSLFPVIKVGYRVFSVNTASIPSILLFAGIRFLLCGAVMVLYVSLRDRHFAIPDSKNIVSVLLVSMSGYVMHYALLYVGVSHLDSSKTSILKQIGSLFIACFAFLFRKEDGFSAKKMIGGFLGFLSIVVVNVQHFKLKITVFDLLIIGASFCSVASTIFSKNAYDTKNPIYVTAWAQLYGGIVLTVLGLSLGGRIGTFSTASVEVLFYMVFASCLGYALWNSLLKYNDLSRMNIIKFSEMLFSALCSWTLLGENIFKIEYLFSFFLILLGIIVSDECLGERLSGHRTR